MPLAATAQGRTQWQAGRLTMTMTSAAVTRIGHAADPDPSTVTGAAVTEAATVSCQRAKAARERPRESRSLARRPGAPVCHTGGLFLVLRMLL
jgi:hypothetical protein